ncbi:MAG: endopeptidase La [Deltaproteobacteria bacterium]|nr:endopeptidase La [Deltaproteobacteria bacterium]
MLFNLNRNKPGSKSEGERLHLPLLPLRDVVVFPYMVVPLFVGREQSIKALEHAMNLEKSIFLATQIDPKIDDPSEKDIHRIGIIGSVLQLLRLPDGTVKALVEGKARARVLQYMPHQDFFFVETELLVEIQENQSEIEALCRSVISAFESYAKVNKKIPAEVVQTVNSLTDPSKLADTVVAHLNIKTADKQNLLELVNLPKRLEKLYELMRQEVEVMEIEQRIKGRIKKQMEQTQKEYYLHEQMRAIQSEMGEKDDLMNEIQELEKLLAKKRLSREAKTKVAHEIKKLKMMSPQSAEATVVRNYIDWILSLPWYERTRDIMDIKEAERILEEDHYGLKKPKERILEYLAVQKLVKKIKGPILCFVGPPGVGKTSLATSVARATGRHFIRFSLGGVRDEAEIRGHRRTYIGALPGKIIQSLRKAKSNNPVFCLDEVDKMSMDFRGDPSAALLEVLDPEQNHAFNDHYLDLDYDLSQVLFITTANTLYSIPSPLQDRMEIIRLPGYLEDEKLNIAKQFLVKKQIENNGLKESNIHFSDRAILQIIRRYTREAGVRSLEREIASICRKAARAVVKDPDRKQIRITAKNVFQYLGVPKFRYGMAEERDEIGLATGLAWTEVGGEILMTEVVIMPGRGQLTLTGHLGDVMKESAQAALSYVRSRAAQLGLAEKFYRKVDIHVHVPEGAIPKDGPSAGITITTAIVSALIKKRVHRDIAMTGEITLRGRVLPIGGLKEKTMAAHRSNIKTVLIPKENEKDIKEISPQVLKSVKLILVEHMDEVLQHAVILKEGETLFVEPEVETEPAFLPSETETGPEITAH